MKKRMIQLMALALVALGVVSGCSAKAQLPTEIGSFAVVDVSMVDTYDTLQAESGQKGMSHDLSFASAVAVYGMLLTDSAYKGIATYKMVEELAEAGITVQTDERNMAQASNDQLYRSQFLELVRKTEKIPQREPAAQMWQCD